ncbi:methylthioribulose 1-phosphate dehydratase [Streptomyces coeruleorubidus]|uniref:methylthioribulose 1-phosphate dehydratase n=1 Tax=Streptomyces coeruleorubidus TaxID=116188 RepID=UPI0033D96AB2
MTTPVQDLRGTPPVTDAAAELARYSRVLYERGWMPGTSGNLSVRQAGGLRDTALITPSGRDKGELTRDDMVTVHAETGEPRIHGPLRASAETCIHAAVYRTTAAEAVIHVHSPYATVVACRAGDPARRTTVPLTRFELLKGLGLADPAATRVPVFPNWSDVPRIADDVADWLRATPDAPPGLLIADHGITAWGRDLAQALARLECFEAICQLLVLGARSREDHLP